jgi:hypothetical protein
VKTGTSKTDRATPAAFVSPGKQASPGSVFRFEDLRGETVAQQAIQQWADEFSLSSAKPPVMQQKQAAMAAQKNFTAVQPVQPPQAINSEGVAQRMLRVKRQKITAINPANEQIFDDALTALHEVQEQTLATVGSFGNLASGISDYIQANGIDAVALGHIEELYTEMAEISFKSNPILHEAWDRCIAATRGAAAQSKYGSVGGKFRKKFEEVLKEIGAGYGALQGKIDLLITVDVNKEHLINKGLGGEQVEHQNLVDAGVGEKHFGGRGTLSAFHKELHRLKSGGYKVDFDGMDAQIRKIIQEVQDGYESDDMGALQDA